MKLNPRKIAKLRCRIEKLHGKGGIKSKELESLAKACGRTKHKRGKEPNWINENHVILRPLSIPHHGTELNKFTAGGILNNLENDLDYFESLLEDTNDGEVEV